MALAISEQPPYPSEPQRHEPDPNWPPPQYHAPRAYTPSGRADDRNQALHGKVANTFVITT